MIRVLKTRTRESRQPQNGRSLGLLHSFRKAKWENCSNVMVAILALAVRRRRKWVRQVVQEPKLRA